MPEIIDPVFAKTSPKRSFCVTENERFRFVFAKTGSINSGKGLGGRVMSDRNITEILKCFRYKAHMGGTAKSLCCPVLCMHCHASRFYYLIVKKAGGGGGPD